MPSFPRSHAPLLLLWTGTALALLIVLGRPPARTFWFDDAAAPRMARGLAQQAPAWSGPGTQLVLHGLDGPARLELRLKPNPLLAEKAGRFILRRGERILAAPAAAAGKERYAFTLEEGVTAGAWLAPEPLELSCDHYLGRRGAEALGARLLELRVEPRPFWLGWRTAWRAVHLTLIPVLIGLALVRADRVFFAARAGRPLRVLLPVALAGAALVGAAARDPYLLAWVLPPLPATMVVAGLLLLPRGGWRHLARRPRSLAAGLALLCFAQVAFRSTGGPVVGAIAAVLGLLALPDLPSAPPAPGRVGSRMAVGLGLVLLLALGLRIHRIQEIPFGMWRDEARHGLIALRILEDPAFRPAYVAETEPKINLPGFGFYLLAAGIPAFGVNPWSMRVVTAVAGALTVLPVFALGRRLLGDDRSALLSAFLLAVSAWHLIFSRYAFPTVFDPLFTASGLWLTASGASAGSASRGGAALFAGGLVLGLSVQTYHSARLAPLLGGVLLALLWRRVRLSWGRALAWSLGLALALSPLALWVLENPGRADARLGEVSLLGRAPGRAEAPLQALERSALRHLLAFNVRGDLDPHHNLPGRPLLDALSGGGFLAGLAVLWARRSEAGPRFVLAALGLGLLPSVLAIDGPNAMRAIGALPPACFVSASGLVAVIRGLGGPGGRRSLLAAALLALALFLNFRLYFVERPVVHKVWSSMYPVDTAMGVLISALAEKEPSPRVFVPRSTTEEAVLPYLTRGLPVMTFDGSDLSEPWRPGDWFLLPGAERDQALLVLGEALGADPEPVLRGPSLPGTARPSFLAYRARGSAP
jgi:4-amino-4-deoxy-L-arabinose transferase-like glycosyltransferase